MQMLMFDLNKIQTESRSVQRELVWAWEHRVWKSRPPPSFLLPCSHPPSLALHLIWRPFFQSKMLDLLTLMDISCFLFSMYFIYHKTPFFQPIFLAFFSGLPSGLFFISHPCFCITGWIPVSGRLHEWDYVAALTQIKQMIITLSG